MSVNTCPGTSRSALLLEKIGWLDAYARDSFSRLVQAGIDDYPARLKLEHSMLVLAEAEHILAGEGWAREAPEALLEAIRLAALFHDVGRFPQYERYETFSDRVSENHGKLGLRVLLTTGALAGLPPGIDALVSAIRGAVLLHNGHRVPPRLEKATELASRVTRDADKLDIYRIMLDAFSGEKPVNNVVALGLADRPGHRSPKVVEAVRAGRLSRYEDMVSMDDFKILLMSWAYDLSFPASAARLLELGHVRQLASKLPDDELTRELTAQVVSDLERFAARQARQNRFASRATAA